MGAVVSEEVIVSLSYKSVGARAVLLNWSVSPFTSFCVVSRLVCGSVFSVSKADVLLISAELDTFSNGSSGNRRGPEAWSGLSEEHRISFL